MIFVALLLAFMFTFSAGAVFWAWFSWWCRQPDDVKHAVRRRYEDGIEPGRWQ